jgi:hypothetical protein
MLHFPNLLLELNIFEIKWLQPKVLLPQILLTTSFLHFLTEKVKLNSIPIVGILKIDGGVPPCYPPIYFENFFTSILGTKILSRKISESSEKLQYALLIRNFRTFSEISRWEKF